MAGSAKVSRKSSGSRGNRQPRRRQRMGDQPLKPMTVTWRFWTGFLAILLVLSYFGINNKETVAWYFNRPVNSVRLESQLQHVTESEVTALLAVYMGDGFFNIDVTSVRERLETHPWIARAEVKRIWPNSMAVGVIEQVAIARWGQTGLLNQYAEVFEPSRIDSMGSLPLLTGPDGRQTVMMEQYQMLRQMLFPVGLSLDQLTLSDRNSWELSVNGGVKIIIGTAEVRERVKRLIDIYDSQIRNDIAVIESIDLRYSNGFSVKKKSQEVSSVATR